MINVIGVTFKKNGKIYYFSLPNKKLKVGDSVIVRTENGLQFGIVEIPFKQIKAEQLKEPLSQIERIANDHDKKVNEKNKKDALVALITCKKLVTKMKLNMSIIDANYNFDRSSLTFNFVSDTRVDFRNLVKELASIYKTRIELYQMGVRDKAREVGGCGQCGRKLCCARFLSDFDSVSINMAKNQNIALNPNKINGACGRLLCCLKYENDCYTECRKCLPNIGAKMNTEHGMGRVVSIDILSGKYRILVDDYGIVECEIKKNERD